MPDKNNYRKYKITSLHHDDFHVMKEVIIEDIIEY